MNKEQLLLTIIGEKELELTLTRMLLRQAQEEIAKVRGVPQPKEEKEREPGNSPMG